MAQQPCHAACDSQSTLVSSGTRHGTFQRRAGSSAVVREGIASPGRTTYLPHVPNAEHRNCRKRGRTVLIENRCHDCATDTVRGKTLDAHGPAAVQKCIHNHTLQGHSDSTKQGLRTRPEARGTGHSKAQYRRAGSVSGRLRRPCQTLW